MRTPQCLSIKRKLFKQHQGGNPEEHKLGLHRKVVTLGLESRWPCKEGSLALGRGQSGALELLLCLLLSPSQPGPLKCFAKILIF